MTARPKTPTHGDLILALADTDRVLAAGPPVLSADTAREMYRRTVCDSRLDAANAARLTAKARELVNKAGEQERGYAFHRAKRMALAEELRARGVWVDLDRPHVRKLARMVRVARRLWGTDRAAKAIRVMAVLRTGGITSGVLQ